MGISYFLMTAIKTMDIKVQYTGITVGMALLGVGITIANFVIQTQFFEEVEQDYLSRVSGAGHYALEKRPNKGLLAGLWQFPNISGHPDTLGCLEAAKSMGVQSVDILREVHRKHIFTHIVWNMKGIYLEVAEMTGNFQWFTEEEINTQAALPTAFRLFWEELTDV